MYLKRLFLGLILILALLLSACGGSDSGPEPELPIPEPIPDTGDTPTDSVETLSKFEGMTFSLNTDFSGTEVTWQQLSGHPVELEDTTSTSSLLTLPWISQETAVVELQASATINSVVVTKKFDLTILNRRYLVIGARNNDTQTSNLFINYISQNDNDGVPTPETIQLTSLPAGQQVCAASISPSGQYLAYSINGTPSLNVTTCRGVYIVDIETQIQRKVSNLTANGGQIIVRSLKWSPDGLKLAYRGNHGEGINQYYVINTESTLTSYVNYGNNNENLSTWPAEDLFPIADGGNPYSLELLTNTQSSIFSWLWLNNSEGLSFSITDSETSDDYLYQASIHGHARKLERAVTISESLSILDRDAVDAYNEALLECPPEGICAVIPIPPIFLELNDNNLISPDKMRSSVDGHLSTLATMRTNDSTVDRVLAVRSPVNDNASAPVKTAIEASDIFDADWSPVANHLAFASGFDIRHRHTQDDVPLKVITGPEKPGQLYFYENYQPGHSESQERLANPQPNIDVNFVRQLKWSNDGQYIAYVRGEKNVEGPYYTSVWVTAVDNVRDQSDATIDANTTLLTNLRAEGIFATDFMFAPNAETVVIFINTIEGRRLRFVSRDAQVSFDSQLLTGFTGTWLDSIEASFSPDGQYFAYMDEEQSGNDDIQAIFVQDLNGGERVRVNAPLQTGDSIRQRTIQWTPHGDAIIYSVTSVAQGARYFLAQVDGDTQSLEEFLAPSLNILYVLVK